MQRETALSRARAALQHNPLLLLMCALSVLVHKTAVTTAAPIAGSFPYRCVKYQRAGVWRGRLSVLCSSERGGNRQSCDWGQEPMSRRQTDLGRKPLAGEELLKVLLINNKRAHKKPPKLPAIGGLTWQRLRCL